MFHGAALFCIYPTFSSFLTVCAVSVMNQGIRKQFITQKQRQEKQKIPCFLDIFVVRKIHLCAPALWLLILPGSCVVTKQSLEAPK